MAWPPSIAEFQAQFVREFVYGTGYNSVQDADITRAITDSLPFFNQSLFPDQQTILTAFLYLAAHTLVMNIQGAGGLSARPFGRGVRNVGEGVQVSKGVGPTNTSYQVPPERIAQNPMFLYLFRTDFGQRYMMIMEPYTVGSAFVVCGPNFLQWGDE